MFEICELRPYCFALTCFVINPKYKVGLVGRWWLIFYFLNLITNDVFIFFIIVIIFFFSYQKLSIWRKQSFSLCFKIREFFYKSSWFWFRYFKNELSCKSLSDWLFCSGWSKLLEINNLAYFIINLKILSPPQELISPALF